VRVELEGCRRSVFEVLERPAMPPLPAPRYQLAMWKKARVNIDYHLETPGRTPADPSKPVLTRGALVRRRPIEGERDDALSATFDILRQPGAFAPPLCDPV